MSENKTFDKQETPRTDAIENEASFEELADFARKLERELAEDEDALTSWYVAASPYATPEALQQALSATLPIDVIAALRRVADPQDGGEPFEFWPVYWPTQDEQGGCVLCGNGTITKPASKLEDHAKTCGLRAAYEILSKYVKVLSPKDK